MGKKIFKIGVFGSAVGDTVKKCSVYADVIGQSIGQEGHVLCTGACGGIPHIAAQGAARYGGVIFGFSPAINHKEHVQKYQFPDDPYMLVFTGMEKKGRNMICTRTCDAGIFIAGRWGTMNEFTLMCDEGEGKVIGLLEGSGGFVDSMIIPGLKETDKPTNAIIVIESDPYALAKEVLAKLTMLYL